jgi:SNF2 family DNA or RNA helicase
MASKPQVLRSGTTAGAAPGSGIRDNHSRGSVGDFLREKIRDGSSMSVVSAYFTIYAFDALRAELEKIDGMRFLFGEPRFIGSIDPDRTDKKAFKIEDEGLTLANRLEQKRVARDCAAWISAKAQIRSVRQTNLLHGKMYHIAKNGIEDAILGSSNFTVRGLGLSTSNNNIELNLEVDSNRDRRDLRDWFDEIWNDNSLAEDVTQEVLHYLGQLYANHAPEFIYFKTLYHIFERFLAAQNAGGLLFQNTQIVETEIWRTLFEFQKDGVKGAINKINAHNGYILADSVGLGKTFETLAVIKYFELRNHRVLVLCPKKLRENWTIYQAQNNSELNPFVRDRFAYTVLSHTDLSRESGRSGDIDLGSLNWGNYDLVVTNKET